MLFTPAETKVVIVGGGPAGMEAARVAAELPARDQTVPRVPVVQHSHTSLHGSGNRTGHVQKFFRRSMPRYSEATSSAYPLNGRVLRRPSSPMRRSVA